MDPDPLTRAFVGAGWTLCLPRADSRDGRLSFHTGDGEMTPDAYGILAPPVSAPALIPDLIIVPLLAFDRRGGRLGQGAGCYDRTIAALRASGSPRVIGLAFAGQEVERVPMDDHDQRLDGILTDMGFIEVIHPPA